jgi:hypothetical protein
MVVGCMAIHLCKCIYNQSKGRGLGKKLTGPGGHRFTDRQEQNRLIQVLTKTSGRHGWPTHFLERQLRDTWDMA